MKLYLNPLKENWVVDNVISEWNKYQGNLVTSKIKESDIIWLIAPWTWRKLSKTQLRNKKVVCTIHHIDFDKFDENEKNEFYKRDKYVDFYHTVSYKSEDQIKKLTDKKIYVSPFWVNQNIFYEIADKSLLRNQYNIPLNSFIVGSFQRDTEGHDLKSPKLSKGPDRFLEIVLEMRKSKDNLEVLLTGKRRQYLINNLKKENIKFHYFEMVDFITLNNLYNTLDLYIVSSRVEGGPRALFECAITKTPVISTDVGFASNLLSEESLFEGIEFGSANPNVDFSKNIVKKYEIPRGFENFIKMFEEVYES